MSKIAAFWVALVTVILLSIPMSAQILPRGNVYAGVSYGQFDVDVVQQSYKGWNGSAEDLPFARLPHLGFVLDASGYYRTGVTQYNASLGPRLSGTFGKYRPFVQAMGGMQRINSSGNLYTHYIIDFGGGVDYKLPFRNFSWRLQGDLIHAHYLSANENNYRASTGLVWRF